MSRSMKTIVLWVILIIFFVAFYQIFRGGPAADSTTPAEPREGFGTLNFFARWMPVVMLALFGWIYFQSKRAPRVNQGVRLLTEGRYVQALEEFERVRKTQKDQPAAVYNCGVTRLQLWKVEAALADFDAAKKLLGGNALAGLGTLLPEHYAMAYALIGFLAEARKALAEIPASQGDPGRVALATAIIQTRERDWAKARETLNTVEVKQMAGTIGALARTVDALCIEQLTSQQRHLDRVALFGEASPDELKKHWPELIAFVERAPAW